ncbi:MAG: hypothetical protein H7230_01890 [Candidatus Parcubacteria bacterium]|nr:hypothetical protein [Candidatus Paceibacterota bacterium]
MAKLNPKSIQNPFQDTDLLTEIIRQDISIKERSKQAYQAFKSKYYRKPKPQTLTFMSRIFKTISTHSTAFIIGLVLAGSAVGASAAQLVAPENLKPSTIFNELFKLNKQPDKNPFTKLIPDDKNDVVLSKPCDLAIKYPKEFNNTFVQIYSRYQPKNPETLKQDYFKGAFKEELTISGVAEQGSGLNINCGDLNSSNLAGDSKPKSLTRLELAAKTGWFVTQSELKNIQLYQSVMDIYDIDGKTVKTKDWFNLIRFQNGEIIYNIQWHSNTDNFDQVPFKLNEIQLQFNSKAPNQSSKELIAKDSAEFNGIKNLPSASSTKGQVKDGKVLANLIDNRCNLAVTYPDNIDKDSKKIELVEYREKLEGSLWVDQAQYGFKFIESLNIANSGLKIDAGREYLLDQPISGMTFNCYEKDSKKITDSSSETNESGVATVPPKTTSKAMKELTGWSIFDTEYQDMELSTYVNSQRVTFRDDKALYDIGFATESKVNGYKAGLYPNQVNVSKRSPDFGKSKGEIKTLSDSRFPDFSASYLDKWFNDPRESASNSESAVNYNLMQAGGSLTVSITKAISRGFGGGLPCYSSVTEITKDIMRVDIDGDTVYYPKSSLTLKGTKAFDEDIKSQKEAFGIPDSDLAKYVACGVNPWTAKTKTNLPQEADSPHTQGEAWVIVRGYKLTPEQLKDADNLVKNTKGLYQ